MLEKIRENSRSVLVWVLFGIIIAFFIISFGPQASESQFSCGGASQSFVIKVGDKPVGTDSWRFAMQSMGVPTGTGLKARAQRARERVFDKLVERELLAQAAEDMGIAFSNEEVKRSFYDLDTQEGNVFLLGTPIAPHIDEDGVFDFDVLKSVAQQLGLSGVGALQLQQERELLANAMREYIVSTARVALDEARGRYDADNRTAAVEFVKFAFGNYKRGLDLSDERLEQWLANNEAKAKERYEADKETRYSGVPKQVFVRTLFVKREKPAPPTAPDGETADDAADESGDEPAPEAAEGGDATADPGLAVANAARARIEGGEDFATVAKELSQDANKERGGAVGWRSLSSLGLGPEISGAVEALEVGTLSEVIEAPLGFYVVRFDEAREGNLSFDQVKLEIARQIAADDIAKEAARADAEAALAQLQAGGTLESLFGDRPDPSDTPADADADDSDEEADKAPAGPPYAFPETDLPRPEGLEAPDLQTARRVTRQGSIVAGANLRPYVGKSVELVKKVFETQEVGAKPSEVLEVDDGFVLLKVSERKEPDFEKFAATKNQTLLRASRQKGINNLQDWLAERCTEAAAAQQIVYDAEYVTYYDDDENPIKVDYQPCQTTAQLNAMRRLGM